jgi:hypothetical protein
VESATLAESGREVIDEFGGGDEERIEAVLDGAIRDGDGQVRFAATGFAGEDESAAVGDEVGRESRAQQSQTHGRLIGEIEIIDGLQEREAGATREASESRLLAVSNLFGDQDGE